MQPAQQIISDVKVIKINSQLRTVRTNFRQQNKCQNILMRDRVIERPQYEGISLKEIGDQNQSQSRNKIDFCIRDKSKTYQPKVNVQENFPTPGRTSFVSKNIQQGKISSLSPKFGNQENIEINSSLKQVNLLRQNNLVQRYNPHKSKIARLPSQCSSSQSEKSIVWKDSYVDILIESEFDNDLSKEEKFILLYKYRYEKEHNRYISREKLTKQIKQFGFQFQYQNKEIFKQNYAYPYDTKSNANYKQFFQMTISKNKKDRILPDIYANEKFRF